MSARHTTQRLPITKEKFLGIIALLVNLFAWGISPAIIKLGLNTVSPEVFLYYRFLIVLLITTPFLLLFPKTYHSVRSWKHLLFLFVIGLLTTPITLGMLFVGLQYTTSLAGAILAVTTPIFTLVGSTFFLREHITRQQILGTCIATGGSLLILLETPAQAHATNPVFGNTLIFLSNITWTIGIIFMKKYAFKYSPMLFSHTSWIAGFLFFLFYALWTDPAPILHPLLLLQYTPSFLSIVYMAIFGSLIGFTSYQIAQKYLPASQVSIFGYLQSIVAIPLSIFWLHEKLGFWFLVGSLFLTIGVIVTELRKNSTLAKILKKT